jgi:hypothetical protein
MLIETIKELSKRFQKLITIRRVIVFVVFYVLVADLLAVLPYVNVALTEYKIKIFLAVSIIVAIYKPSLEFVVFLLYLLLVIKPVGESTGILVYIGFIYIWFRLLRWQKLLKD